MNPRKLIDSHEPEKILKLGVDYHVHHRHTHFHFPDDQGSLDKALQRCVGIGACRKKDAGTMCRSYQVIRGKAPHPRPHPLALGDAPRPDHQRRLGRR
jgi:hypothetical protein